MEQKHTAPQSKLLALIDSWQRRATAIAMPESGLCPARGGLAGSAFFPEGRGLLHPDSWPSDRLPSIVVIGHNFGCEEYRRRIEPQGHETKEPTWRNFEKLIERATLSMNDCFLTNWFIGLLPGNQQEGRFLRRPDHVYETQCRQLLLDQPRALQTRRVFLLGREVVNRSHTIMGALAPWRDAASWKDVDQRLCPVQLDTVIDGTQP